jgi:hypothetical protein
MGMGLTEEAMESLLPQRASAKQVGGSHYKDMKIQPERFIYENGIPYHEACAIKYLCRWRKKAGIQDLEKAKHVIELLIEHVLKEELPKLEGK